MGGSSGGGGGSQAGSARLCCLLSTSEDLRRAQRPAAALAWGAPGAPARSSADRANCCSRMLRRVIAAGCCRPGTLGCLARPVRGGLARSRLPWGPGATGSTHRVAKLRNTQAVPSSVSSGLLAAAAASGGVQRQRRREGKFMCRAFTCAERPPQLEPPMRLYSGFHWKRGRQPSLLRRY